jgi:excisionase family DNA binding protein
VGLGRFVSGELIEIIEWVDDTRDTLSFRFPDSDREIKRGAQLIVRESQAAQFVYLGQFGDTFRPGKYRLTTDNMPVLTKLKGWKYGFESPFKADVYFVTTRLFTGNKWGTANAVMMHDAEFGIVRLRAFGTYDFRVTNVPHFLKEVAGTDDHFTSDQFVETMRSRLVSVFSTALATSRIPALDAAARYRELGDALLPLVNPILTDKYGVELASFVVENVSVPPHVEKAIDKRSGMGAVGNLNDFIKYQLAQGLESGGPRVAGLGAEMAVGATVAQQLINQPGANGAAALDVLTPADAAKLLGVTEADVVASLEAGELKGRRIGSQWRVARSAIDQFMR